MLGLAMSVRGEYRRLGVERHTHRRRTERRDEAGQSPYRANLSQIKFRRVTPASSWRADPCEMIARRSLPAQSQRTTAAPTSLWGREGCQTGAARRPRAGVLARGAAAWALPGVLEHRRRYRHRAYKVPATTKFGH